MLLAAHASIKSAIRTGLRSTATSRVMSSGASTSASLPPGVEKLRSLLNGAHSSQSWDAAWKAGLTPWDKGAAQPALVATLDDEQLGALLPRSGRAAVPGMGRGFDAELLARRGLHVTGVDISETAVEEARKWLDAQPSDAAHERITLRAADWFAMQPVADDAEEGPTTSSRFDLCYDYTFFCALPSTLHDKWAQAYTRLIKPGGKLLALVYPIQGDRPGGPPYSVDPERYKQLLSPAFELEHQAPPLVRGQDREEGLEQIMIWRRKADTPSAL
ncbi:S-adenosyl-L-methionine-dependent methyltransferase [Tilletiopsis washingtonensis]|uniref:S-adenosyl-L-methionine-dependent methyltransferase n=1 Tax=Tilletiopsis washingtonensis TaxID=58919 RepID=A0A316ZDE4_9BASI|nr:S-adenosyl-L-methionine-dependent methyltransferase [Tilletiopsis washingtonensis]PWN98932.1 S-adenosyl-L-methionine-dependent methyltransferase [Tilletiopsis washingtonensis]